LRGNEVVWYINTIQTFNSLPLHHNVCPLALIRCIFLFSLVHCH